MRTTRPSGDHCLYESRDPPKNEAGGQLGLASWARGRPPFAHRDHGPAGPAGPEGGGDPSRRPRGPSRASGGGSPLSASRRRPGGPGPSLAMVPAPARTSLCGLGRRPEPSEAGLRFSRQAPAPRVGTIEGDGPEAAEETSNASADAVYRRRASGRPQARSALVRPRLRLNRLWSSRRGTPARRTSRPSPGRSTRHGCRRGSSRPSKPVFEPVRRRGTLGGKCDHGNNCSRCLRVFWF
jgi:hypothetical protein